MNFIKRFLVAIIVIGFVGWTGVDQARSQSKSSVDSQRLHQEAESILLRALDDPQFALRQTALSVLGSLYLPIAAPKLLELLKNRDEDVREAAITALGISPSDPFIVQVVLERLKSDPSAKVRSKAALVFPAWRVTETVPALIDRLLNDRETEVRANAALALGFLGDASALPALRQTLQETLRAYETASSRSAIEISTLLSSVTAALVLFKDRAAVPAVAALIAPPSDSDQNFPLPFPLFGGLNVVIVLIVSKDPDYNLMLVDTIRPLLNHRDSSVRLRAALAMRALGDRTVVSKIADALTIPQMSDPLGSLSLFGKVLELFLFAIVGFVQDDELVPAISDLMDELAKPVSSQGDADLNYGIRNPSCYLETEEDKSQDKTDDLQFKPSCSYRMDALGEQLRQLTEAGLH
ncbi:HEAT repeat domain-containing protein, partial [Candidatus Acetothermia bacterium]|nr:HEAT repeat domain-containing protein [Candidatus Acetothermia bacterium]